MIKLIHKAVMSSIHKSLSIQKQREYERLTILKILESINAYKTNNEVLQDIITLYGINISSTVLMDNIKHLEDQGLISTHTFSTLTILTLRSKGSEALRGVIGIEGVRPPLTLKR